MTRQENNTLLLPLCLLGNIPQSQYLLARNVNALVVCPQQKLGNSVVCASNKRLAFKLANHIVGHVLGHVLQTLDQHSPSLGTLHLKVLVTFIQESLFYLNIHSHVR